MGQRLNIEIVRKKDNKVLANCYYHWSAYTFSAIRLTLDILKGLHKFDNETNDTYKAIKLLQLTNAGLTQEEFNKISIEDRQDLIINEDRNKGLISFTENNIELTRKWEEGRVTIYLDSKNTTIDFDIYFYNSKEDMQSYYTDININDIPIIDLDLSNLSIKDFKTLDKEFEDLKYGLFRLAYNKDMVYQIIE